MENKYYIPSVNEFHAGFEYEIKCFDDGSEFEPFIQDLLEPPTISTGSGFCPFEYALDEGHVRVKFLDREDIESLGFRFFGCRLKSDLITCNYPMVYDVKEPREEKAFGHNPKTLYMISNVGDNLFDIENKITGAKAEKVLLKNKSELKRLLTQLGISK